MIGGSILVISRLQAVILRMVNFGGVTKGGSKGATPLGEVSEATPLGAKSKRWYPLVREEPLVGVKLKLHHKIYFLENTFIFLMQHNGNFSGILLLKIK
ncbi:hypothetical protein Hanom_Chr07g00629131 [Helianthus anomalus]